MFRRHFLYGLAGVGAVPAPAADRRSTGVCNVLDFGATGDGTKLNTREIQAAIDACAKGGGTVYFPGGRFLSGTLLLRSNVVLYLDAGAVLLGSKNLQDYPVKIPAIRSYTDNYTDKSLIYAENQENVGIEGKGTIDGQGAAFEGPYKMRPYLIRFITCRNVSVSGITLRNSPMWLQHYLACDRVAIHGITVDNTISRNADGVDIDSCDGVTISDSQFTSRDDSIVLKSTSDRQCRNVTVTNCVVRSLCNALKLGTESNGGFSNITFSNCTVHDTRLSGIALEIVDGGVLERVNVSNIVMKDVGAPIFIRLGNRARPYEQGGPRPGIGTLRDVIISNVEADGASGIGCAIAGLPGHNIERVTLDNIRLRFEGGGKRQDALREIPENAEKYPEHTMFGTLPAYGFYCRHASDIRFQNVQVSAEQPDERPGLVCDDVDGLDVFGVDIWNIPGAEPPLVMQQVRNAFVHGCRASRQASVWLRVAGSRSHRIFLSANDLGLADKAVEVSEDVPKGAVSQ